MVVERKVEVINNRLLRVEIRDCTLGLETEVKITECGYEV